MRSSWSARSSDALARSIGSRSGGLDVVARTQRPSGGRGGHHAALDAIALAAEQRYALAALVRHVDVVDASPSARTALACVRGEDVALACRRQEIDAAPRRDGDEVVAVACER